MNLCECIVPHSIRGTVCGFLSVCGWTCSSFYGVLIDMPEQNLKESYLAYSAVILGQNWLNSVEWVSTYTATQKFWGH